jgi:hypothetical protein
MTGTDTMTKEKSFGDRLSYRCVHCQRKLLTNKTAFDSSRKTLGSECGLGRKAY